VGGSTPQGGGVADRGVAGGGGVSDEEEEEQADTGWNDDDADWGDIDVSIVGSYHAGFLFLLVFDVLIKLSAVVEIQNG